jgi:PPM family protein phosphatase
MEEITAEFVAKEVVTTTPLRVIPKVSFGAKTDMGRVRENNEDKHEFFIPETESELASRGLVFIVCDGMGGHEAGQVASEVAIKSFIDSYRSHPSLDSRTAAEASVAAANRTVKYLSMINASRRGMGTTLTALALIQDQALIAHVGDSRAYRLRGGALETLTTDHTWVEETVRMGTLTREEAEIHPYRHIITRAIGVEEDVTPDVSLHPVEAGDIYLLCSDGVTNHVEDFELAETLSTSTSPSAMALALINRALGGGGSDNATVIVVRVDSLSPADPLPA